MSSPVSSVVLSGIREPQVAGHFYPADPGVLTTMVDAALAQASRPVAAAPKALVAPHAGYVYSGPVAGTAYAALGPVGSREPVSAIRRVILLGPAHRAGFGGLALMGAAVLRTPLGLIPVDQATVSALLTLPEVRIRDEAFAMEHSLEVHLPFLQRRLQEFTLVPLLVGDVSPEGVERVLEKVWGGPETLIVVSSDLSHYDPYEIARVTDAETCRLAETLQAEGLEGRRACGFRPWAGLLRRARALDLRVTTLDCRNSGDTAGGRDRVVGYGAFGFEYAHAARLADSERQHLHWVARTAIARGLKTGKCPPVDVNSFPPALRAYRATFVTVTLDEALRGCIGSVAPVNPLAADVAQSAFKAAFSDPRFPPLTPEEAERVAIHVSILSHPRPLHFRDEADLVAQIRPDVDGLILESAGRRGLFLPSVWEKLPDPVLFVRHLKGKAGFPPDYWANDLRVWRYTTESF